jgi:hypothetical protein
MVLQVTNFDAVSGLMAKNIKFATIHAFTEYKKEVWQFCVKEKTDQQFEQMMGYEGFGAVPEINEGGDITPVDFEEGHKTTIAQRQWAYEVRVTWNQRTFAAKSAGFSKQIGFFLGRSGNLRYEYTGADILNNGFTDAAAYHGGDGKPLFSPAHTWKSTNQAYSNVLSSADASKTSIKNGLKTVHNAKMEQNIPASLTVTDILFGYENVFDIPEILKSSLDPESANKRYNALKDAKLNPVLLHYITDTDAFYFTTKNSYLAIIEATAPFLSTEMYHNKDMGENIWMSMNNGFKNPLDTYGNQGA